MKSKFKGILSVMLFVILWAFTGCVKENDPPPKPNNLFYITIGDKSDENIIMLDSTVALYIYSKDYAALGYQKVGQAELNLGSYTITESLDDNSEEMESLSFEFRFFSIDDHRVGRETSVTSFGDFYLHDSNKKKIYSCYDFIRFNKTVYTFTCTYKKNEFVKPYRITLEDKQVII